MTACDSGGGGGGQPLVPVGDLEFPATLLTRRTPRSGLRLRSPSLFLRSKEKTKKNVIKSSKSVLDELSSHSVGSLSLK